MPPWYVPFYILGEFIVSKSISKYVEEEEDLTGADDESQFQDPVENLDRLDEDLLKELQKLKNPNLDVASFKPLKQEKPVHRDAFLYWMNLVDNERTNRNVAEQFGVSIAIVGRWKKSFNWDVRRDYLRKEELKSIEKVAKTTLSTDLMATLNTINTVKQNFHNNVKANKVDVSVQDFIKICKLQIELRGALEGEDNGGDSDMLAKLEKVLKGSGDVAGMLIKNMNVMISGEVPLPHDVIIEGEVKHHEQEIIDLNDIGEDDEDVEEEEWSEI